MKRLRFALFSTVALLLLVSLSLDVEAGRRTRDGQRRRNSDPTSDTRTRDRTRTQSRAVRYSQLRSGDVVELSMPGGKMSRFQISSAPLLSEALATVYPGIKTFLAQDTEEPGSRGRFVVLDNRLHGIVLASGGAVVIEAGGTRTESARQSLGSRATGSADCGTEDFQRLQPGLQLEDFSAGSDVHSYRLVISAAAEFTQNAGDAAAAMAEIVVLVNDMTAIYERDAGITFVLEDTLIFEDPATDPFPAVSDDPASVEFAQLIAANQIAVDAAVLPANYDLSLVITRSAGAATFGVTAGATCDDLTKASAGIAAGDGGAVALAHQVGHLFSATHTYNSTLGQCTQREATSAFEPGSGSTIMGGGDCDAETVTTAGEYFHNNSIEQILGFRDINTLCGVAGATGNTVPAVDAGPDATVPRDTPFRLTAAGSDTDGDALSYTWEQFDLGVASPPLNEADGPLFRSLPPSSDPSRPLPSMENLLSGVEDPFERLPLVDRSLTFRVTVRDENGGVADDEMLVTVAGDPFQVLSPNGGELFSAGCSLPVSWQVGGGALSATVNILLLDEESGTVDMLAEGTANDGDEVVPVPCMSSSVDGARIVVEAADGIFFDMSDGGFTIDLAPPEILMEVAATPVDEACMSTISYTADISDDCGVDAADVGVSATLTSANATLGAPSLDAQQLSPMEVTASGDVLVSALTGSPAVVQIELSATDSCEAETTVMEEVMVSDLIPPVVTCPEDVVVECSAFGGVPVDDPLLVDFFTAFAAEDNCDPDPAIGNDAPALFPLGSTGVEFTATDASGNLSACTAIVTVVDTTPPDVVATVSPSMIWPPNHKLWKIQARVTVTDICDPNPVTVLESVESNEPGNGQGDGNTEPDVVGADLQTLDLQFQVRAERTGTGGGRVYTILYTATDSSSNIGVDDAQVTIPHDQRNRNRSR